VNIVSTILLDMTALRDELTVVTTASTAFASAGLASCAGRTIS